MSKFDYLSIISRKNIYKIDIFLIFYFIFTNTIIIHNDN